jgi:hypothetical protein
MRMGKCHNFWLSLFTNFTFSSLFFVVAVLQHVPDQIEVNFQLQKCQFGPLRDEFRPEGDSQCRGEDREGAADDGGTPTPQQEAGHPSRVSEKNCLNFGEFYGPVLPHKDFLHAINVN